MAVERSVQDSVSEYLDQNPEVSRWVDSFRGYCESEKQWSARRAFILRNMEEFDICLQLGQANASTDRLLSLSMVWANHVFLGCSYPSAVMEKVLKMGEGIVVHEAPVHKTTKDLFSKGKHGTSSEGDADPAVKRVKSAVTEPDSRASGRSAPRPVSQKTGPLPQAPAEHQPFFNRLYKAVAWKLVSAGGFGPNLDHVEILRSCVESCKQTLTCVFVPLKDITGLPAGRTQKEGHVCEIRCQTVYMGTGYGRDETAAKAMASKEALKVFQGRKVTVKICRRRFNGKEVDDLVLLDEQPRSQGFPPALSYPFTEQNDPPDPGS